MDFVPHLEFSSLFVVHNRLSRELDSRMRHYGVSTTGFLALLEISRCQQPGHRWATRASLARALGTNASSMSILIGRFVREGYVQEQAMDGKSNGVQLTDKGRRAVHGGTAAWDAVFEEASAHLSEAKKRQMLQGACQIIAGFNEETLKERYERNLRMVRKHRTRRIMIESESQRQSAKKTIAD